MKGLHGRRHPSWILLLLLTNPNVSITMAQTSSPLRLHSPPPESNVSPAPSPNFLPPTQYPVEEPTDGPEEDDGSESPVLEESTPSPSTSPSEQVQQPQPTANPTPKPTARVTLSPPLVESGAPSGSPTTPPVVSPSAAPSPSPTSTSAPLPTPSPSEQPIAAPIEPPSPTPSLRPTPTPSSRPSPSLVATTSTPTITTTMATEDESDINDKGDADAADEPILYFESSVPIDFDATVQPEMPSDDAATEAATASVQAIWAEYILQRLQAAYRHDDQVVPDRVDLTTTARTRRRKRRRYGILRRHRSLQEEQLQQGEEDATSTVLTSQGKAIFQVADAADNTDNDNDAAFEQEALKTLDFIITEQGLNQALVLAVYINDTSTSSGSGGDGEKPKPPITVSSVENYSGSSENTTRSTTPDNSEGTDTSSTSSSSSHEPTTAEIVIGFLLLAVTIVSLFVWAYVLWKRHKKKQLKKRQQQAMLRRKNQSIVVGGGAGGGESGSIVSGSRSLRQIQPTVTASSTMGTTPPRYNKNRALQLQTTAPDDNSSSSSSVYAGLGGSDDDDDARGDDDDNDDSTEAASEFGEELRRAVDLDQAVWAEFQRKKARVQNEQEFAAKNNRNINTTGNAAATAVPVVVGLTIANGRFRPNPRDTDTGSLSYSSVGASSIARQQGYEEEGYEVDATGRPTVSIQRIRSFPYGDETTNQDNHYMTTSDAAVLATARAVAVRPRDKNALELELSLSNAVEWTTTGISLKVPEDGDPMDNRDGSTFEPYGDNTAIAEREQRGLEASWDLDVAPVVDTDKPSQYSFVYPLKRVDLSDNTPSTVNNNNNPAAPASSAAGATAATASSSDPSSAAVMGSPTVSSWSTSGEKAAAGPAPPALQAFPEEDYPSSSTRREVIDEQEDSKSQGDDNEVSFSTSEDDVGATADMLKEVMRLSQYVKRYEQRKEMRKSVQQELQRNQEMSAAFLTNNNNNNNSLSLDVSNNSSAGAEESKSVPYEPLNDSTLSSGTFRQSLPSPPRQGATRAMFPNTSLARKAADPPAHQSSSPSSPPSPQRQPPAKKSPSLLRQSLPSELFQPRQKEEAVTVARQALPYPSPTTPGSADLASRWERIMDLSPAEDEVDDPSLEAPETSASEDDADDSSQRLGISRYSVEMPPPPLLSLSPNLKKSHDVREALASPPVVSPEEQGQAQVTKGSNSEPTVIKTVAGIPRRAPPPQGNPKHNIRPGAVIRSGALSSLRTNRAFLDLGDEDGGDGSLSSSTAPFDEAKRPSKDSKTKTNVISQSPSPLPAQAKWSKNFELSPRAKSNNKYFNNIVSMFDSTGKQEPLVPPNPHWQYEK